MHHTIALLLILALIGLGWWDALGARTRARRAVRRACRAAGVGFIDEVALQRLWVGRCQHAPICIKRRYGFEFFVTGEQRYAGEVEMHALRVVCLRMDPHPFDPEDPT